MPSLGLTTKRRFHLVLALTGLITLAGIGSTRYWSPGERSSSFSVFYTASCLVRSDLNVHLYDGIERGVNPQLVVANPSTMFAQTARAHGIAKVMLYVYPPTLADLLVPLTVFSPAAAFVVWSLLNLAMIVSAAVILTRMLGIKSPVWGGLVVVFLICFRPTLSCFNFGQVSILLLFLLIAGVSSYARGWKNAAGFLFALATAIKLTPLIVIIPVLAWRDWKTLRSIVLWCAAIGGALWAVNGSAALNLYFRHVLPSMSGGNLGAEEFSYTNRTLGDIFYRCMGAGDQGTTPVGAVWLVRIVSIAVIAYAGWLSRADKEKLTNEHRVGIIAVFLLLSCCVSPFSWLYAWVLCAPALIMIVAQIADGRSSTLEATLLLVFLISLLTSKFHLGIVTPPVGVALGLIVLHRLKSERQSGDLSESSHLKSRPHQTSFAATAGENASR